MASPRTITIVALSFALGLFFVFMGTIKLTPRLSKDAYSEMVSVSDQMQLLHLDHKSCASNCVFPWTFFVLRQHYITLHYITSYGCFGW